MKIVACECELTSCLRESICLPLWLSKLTCHEGIVVHASSRKKEECLKITRREKSVEDRVDNLTVGQRRDGHKMVTRREGSFRDELPLTRI